MKPGTKQVFWFFFSKRNGFSAFALLLIALAAAHHTYLARGPQLTARAVIIPPAGTAAAAATLRADGAIKYPLAFRIAAWWTKSTAPLRAGEFLVPAHASIRDILFILRFAPPVQHQITIPEGLTATQIATLFNVAPAATGHVAPLLEGSVLPQTYDYILNTKRPAILARAKAAMAAALALAWAGRDRHIILTSPDQAVTLASIVQAESPLPTEYPEIAAVYENRLAEGMRLQADPTVIYAATNAARTGGIAITRADLAVHSPYNTYLAFGLPPGPICAPGIEALTAVLHPAAIPALYFVATGTGGHIFAEDFSTHLINVGKYRARRAKPHLAIAPRHRVD